MKKKMFSGKLNSKVKNMITENSNNKQFNINVYGYHHH